MKETIIVPLVCLILLGGALYSRYVERVELDQLIAESRCGRGQVESVKRVMSYTLLIQCKNGERIIQ